MSSLLLARKNSQLKPWPKWHSRRRISSAAIVVRLLPPSASFMMGQRHERWPLADLGMVCGAAEGLRTKLPSPASISAWVPSLLELTTSTENGTPADWAIWDIRAARSPPAICQENTELLTISKPNGLIETSSLDKTSDQASYKCPRRSQEMAVRHMCISAFRSCLLAM